jgi:hypothetical protein
MKSIASGLLALACALPAAAADAPRPGPRLGINIAGPADWNSELPFADVFRLSRPWISQRKGAGWGKGPALDLDERGWVRRLEPDCWAETLLCTIEGGHYPAGRYAVLYEGEGTIDLWGAAAVESRAPGRLTARVDPSKGAIFLRLTATDPANPVRAIRVIPPGLEEGLRENPWSPQFLDRWRGVACLRFMDLQETNNSPIASWADRPRPDGATFSERGVPLELLADLANRLEADPWFCIPHRADDDFVRRFATLAKERLDPRRKVFVEYSNEVWNGMFRQNAYAAERGKALGFGDKPWEAAWRYTAVRSVEIFRIWEDVFGGRERLVRVLPSQAANAYVSRQIVEFRDAWRSADALVIAPYVSFNVARDGKLLASEVAKWTVERLLDHIETVALPEAVGWIRESKKVADERGLRLVAYEAGQHLVGVGGAENDEALTRLLQAANRHPRMGAIYRKYLEAWEREGGDLLCHFSSVSKWSKWGSWGLLEHADEDPRTSPKFMAVMEWAKARGQTVNVPGPAR